MQANLWLVVERLAPSIGVSPQALTKAKQRGYVPHPWRVPLLKAAREANIGLDLDAFDEAEQEAV